MESNASGSRDVRNCYNLAPPDPGEPLPPNPVEGFRGAGRTLLGEWERAAITALCRPMRLFPQICCSELCTQPRDEALFRRGAFSTSEGGGAVTSVCRRIRRVGPNRNCLLTRRRKRMARRAKQDEGWPHSLSTPKRRARAAVGFQVSTRRCAVAARRAAGVRPGGRPADSAAATRSPQRCLGRERGRAPPRLHGSRARDRPGPAGCVSAATASLGSQSPALELPARQLVSP